jgi:cell division protein FtsQ
MRSRDETVVAEVVDIDLTQLEREEAGVGGAADPAQPVPVDPRIHARRVEVEREQDRKQRRTLLAALSIFIVVGAGWLMVRAPFVDVDHIAVTGVPPGRAAAIVAASGVHRRDPMLFVSAGAVARRVNGVPGIGSAQVSREFPGTIRIHVHQLGVALWARNPSGGVALIGFDGRVQRDAPAPPPGAIELRGLAHVPKPGGRITVVGVTEVMPQFPRAFARRIGAISAKGPNDVRVYLIVGGEVRLGDLGLLRSKGAVAESVLERIACAVSYVDVSSVANPVAMPAPGAHHACACRVRALTMRGASGRVSTRSTG